MPGDNSHEIPVLIVGGGPIGLALAADLGRRGVRALLIEKNENRIGPPKMLEVSVRTMEFCRQLGIVEEVRSWGFPMDYPYDNAFVTDMQGYEIGRLRAPSLAEQRSMPFSPERGMMCPQTWFDPILQRAARAHNQIEIRHQVRLETFTQDAAGVTAMLRDERNDAREIVRAQYLVGCDGYASTVRELLGIEIRGERHIDWAMNVYLRIPDFFAQHDKARAIRYVFVGPEGTWAFISLVDGKDLWRLQLVGLDEHKLRATDVAALVRRCMGSDIPYSIEERTLWVRKRTVADRFMDGRVFLAGDSAHAHPPNGGLGMNTGLQDAFDLGWKLAATLQGWGGDGLLDTYDIERRPASARAAEVSLANYRRLGVNARNTDLLAPTPAGDAARAEAGARLVEENRKSWHPTGVHLGYIYHPSPIVVPDGTLKPADDTIGYVPTSFPGARAPHAWIGEGASILDLFGAGFVLLNFGQIATAGLERAAAEAGMPLRVHNITAPEPAQLYAAGLVLVRPDGHVAWRGDALPVDCRALIDTVRGAGLRAAAQRATSLTGEASC
jgi:2-polyprenyl-6-methoxyphenol hydroxylase-like FAD-dependent oxidoreductase